LIITRRLKHDKIFEKSTSFEILNEDFLQELNLPQNVLAQAIGVSSNRINEIVYRRGVAF
jgi:plasmid maintenance system antidote protein VapI